MAVIFDDNFESYPINTDPPTGFLDIGFFKGKVVAGPLAGNTGQFYQMGLNGNLLWPETGLFLSAACTVNYEFYGVPGPAGIPIVSYGQSTIGTTFGQGFINLQTEFDGSISIYMQGGQFGGNPSGATLIANSSLQYAWDDCWGFIQLAGTIFQVPLGTNGTFIGVSGDLWYAGTHIANGTGTTNLLVSSQPLGVQMNTIQFSENGNIDNIYAVDTYAGSWLQPHPGTSTSRITQAVAEVIKLPDTGSRKARVTQGVNELIKMPDTTVRNARVTQGVVEIIKKGGGGFVIYET